MSGKGFFDLGGELEGEGVKTLGEIANVLEKVVVGNERGDGGEETGRGGDERFGNARSNGPKTGGAGGAEAREGVDNAPDGAEKSNERSNGGGGSEPGHAFLDAADFVGGSELHADGDRLKRFEFGGRRIAGAGKLGLEFAIACGVDVGEGRAGGDESLRIGDALGGAKDFEELVALAADASENT
jgi:hypothetical protein